MKPNFSSRRNPGRRQRYWLSMAILVLLVAMMADLALASATDTWLPAVNLSNMPGRSFQTSMAHDPITGDILVSWTDDGFAAYEEIMVRRWRRSTQTWLPAQNLSQSAEWERDGGSTLAFDRRGHCLLVWTRTYSVSQGAPVSGHDVLWRVWDGVTWSPEQVLFHDISYLPGSPGTFGLIPVHTPDSILLFITWDTGYRTAVYRNGVLSDLSPWDYNSLDLKLAAMRMDDSGLIHAAAYGPNSNQEGYNVWFHDAYYLTYDGTTWSPAANLSYTDGVASDVGLAFDGQGRLHFLWSDPDSPYSDESSISAIWERVYDNESWSANTEATEYNADQAVSGFSVTSDISGTLHLGWSEGLMVDDAHTDLNLYYQTGDGTGWQAGEQVFASTADSRYPMIGVDDAGAYLVWQEVFWAGGPLYDHEVYFIRQAGNLPEIQRVYLPLIGKGATP